MRLGWTKTKYSVSYYREKTIYVIGKNKSMVVKRFGSEKYICETYGVTDAKAWAKEQVSLMNQAEKEEALPVTMDFFPSRDISSNQQRCFNGGYLFLQSIYYQLGLHKISKAISTLHDFEYNLNSMFSRLIYTRILYPGSKLSGSFQT